MNESPVDRELTKIQANYDAVAGDEMKMKIYHKCTNIANYKYMAISYMMLANCNRYDMLLENLYNNYG